MCVTTKNNTDLSWKIIEDISINSLFKKPLAVVLRSQSPQLMMMGAH